MLWITAAELYIPSFPLLTNPVTATMFVAIFVSLAKQLIFSSIKAVLRSRSSGGYPVMESSGNATISASFFFAFRIWEAIISKFPLISPTVGFICARYNLMVDIFTPFYIL